MTETWDCTEARLSLGVYVLGAIDPVERGMVDAHLATCRDCRDELAGLAGLPALLARVNLDEVSRITADDAMRTFADDQPPPELLGTVRSLAQARERRKRWNFLAAAAAAVVIAGGLFGGIRAATSTTDTRVINAFPPGTIQWETAQATDKASGASATIAYGKAQWGHAFEVLTERIPLGTTCQLWVVHPDGTRTQVAEWTTAGDEGHVWYSGSMASSAGDVTAFQVTANHKVLLAAQAD
jgi:hypothetical protein